MTIELTIPKTGMGIAEGTIQKWLKGEGEVIVKGEVLVEIETAKALEEVEAPISGVLTKIVVAETESADVGAVIALLEMA
ncbi:hypothetical protein NYF23_10110 [SAR92 clade bacterium H455]|uniref:Lipoyl-binding domain-containing protein n=1 Tax=SAR92 clade bacterium H455 TaxID=2974818 RepID=A0ABY5TKQ5_9GAMM|nr:hypothetical protein NYF23_10110 [SAR92 clade bacterium H455]